ncbi:hypothetical protein EPI10_016154 [Gossypium australe]|uniref:Uncharacterized protein n=1 Tax=Gossypium australe TaxID=47621 RepID=A0A5B6VN58_9ROSI|nr:hypothetical protein EPI10_016154 [Gossypium australe]
MEATASQSGQGKASIPKFKKRAVSAVRDWPPGCGPAAGDSYRQIAVVSLSDSLGIESVELQVLSCMGFGLDSMKKEVYTRCTWSNDSSGYISAWGLAVCYLKGGVGSVPISAVDCYRVARVRFLDHDVISGGLATALGRESAKVTRSWIGFGEDTWWPMPKEEFKRFRLTLSILF